MLFVPLMGCSSTLDGYASFVLGRDDAHGMYYATSSGSLGVTAPSSGHALSDVPLRGVLLATSVHLLVCSGRADLRWERQGSNLHTAFRFLRALLYPIELRSR